MLRIAVIGLGVMGTNHYRVLKTLDNVRIVGLCNLIPTAVPYPEPLFYDIDTLLDQVEIDAAIVAVPTSVHKEIAIKCIERHIDLLIEKPVAPNIQEGKAILEKAKEYGAKVVVGYIERFNPVIQALKKELKGKELFSINITRVGPFPPRVADVGVLTDLAVHDIDLIRFITGKEIIHKSIYTTHKTHHIYEDNAVLTFELEDNVIAVITTNWVTPFKRRSISVATPEAYYEADLMTQDLTAYSRFQADHSYDHSYVTRQCFIQKGEPLWNELTSFVKYVRDNVQTISASIEDSIITLDIITNS